MDLNRPLNRHERRKLQALAGRTGKGRRAQDAREIAEIEALKPGVNAFLFKAGPPPFDPLRYVLVCDRVAMMIVEFAGLLAVVEAAEARFPQHRDLGPALRRMVGSTHPTLGVMSLYLSKGPSFQAQSHTFGGDTSVCNPGLWPSVQRVDASKMADRLVNSRGGRA